MNWWWRCVISCCEGVDHVVVVFYCRQQWCQVVVNFLKGGCNLREALEFARFARNVNERFDAVVGGLKTFKLALVHLDGGNDFFHASLHLTCPLTRDVPNLLQCGRISTAYWFCISWVWRIIDGWMMDNVVTVLADCCEIGWVVVLLVLVWVERQLVCVSVVEV
eukprot:6456030-Amphidinium_carterae.2